MIPVPLVELAQVLGAQVVAPEGTDPTAIEALVVDGPVVTDSREAGPGGLYVARVGEHADGHGFVAQAVAAGSVAALTTRAVEGAVCLVVPDTQEAFAALARAVVDRSRDLGDGLTVVGITGSSGKTSTKDLLGGVLADAAPTVVPEGSLNSEVGVPLTVCKVEPDTRFLVVEMGARGIGHIDYLTAMAPPDLAVVLNVGTAHVGEFGSREAIARAKSELPAALTDTGVAVLNADDPHVRAMADVTRGRVVLVGRSEDARVRATDVVLDDRGRPTFTLHTPAGSAPITLALHGEHHVGNALAVVAVALECGLPLDAVVASLSRAGAVSRWRMEVTERPDGVTVVNDAYNANPDSVAAALRALASMRATRRWAVLGSMLELGPDSDAEHAGTGRLAAELGTDELVVVGEVARPMVEGAAEAGLAAHWVPDRDAARALLETGLRAGDVVLLKSSRDAGLRWLGDEVAAAPAASQPDHPQPDAEPDTTQPDHTEEAPPC